MGPILSLILDRPLDLSSSQNSFFLRFQFRFFLHVFAESNKQRVRQPFEQRLDLSSENSFGKRVRVYENYR